MSLALDMEASVELPAPFPAANLRELIDLVPDHGQVKVSTQMGGDQRDPYPVGYLLQAKWGADS